MGSLTWELKALNSLKFSVIKDSQNVCTLNKSKAALPYNFSLNYYKILGQHEKESAVI